MLGLRGNQSTLQEIDKDHVGLRRSWISEDLRRLRDTECWVGSHSVGLVERRCNIDTTELRWPSPGFCSAAAPYRVSS